MLMSDRQIRAACMGNRPLISPYQESSISVLQTGQKITSAGQSSYGFDLTLGRTFKLMRKANQCTGARFIDPCNFDDYLFYERTVEEDGIFVLPPGGFALGVSVERMIMPSDVFGICMQKSTIARAGLDVMVTPVEPEWEGWLTLELYNKTDLPIHLRVGMGIAQMLFIKGDEPCEVTYAARTGKYNHQPAVPVGPRQKSAIASEESNAIVTPDASGNLLKGFVPLEASVLRPWSAEKAKAIPHKLANDFSHFVGFTQKPHNYAALQEKSTDLLEDHGLRAWLAEKAKQTTTEGTVIEYAPGHKARLYKGVFRTKSDIEALSAGSMPGAFRTLLTYWRDNSASVEDVSVAVGNRLDWRMRDFPNILPVVVGFKDVFDAMPTNDFLHIATFTEKPHNYAILPDYTGVKTYNKQQISEMADRCANRILLAELSGSRSHAVFGPDRRSICRYLNERLPFDPSTVIGKLQYTFEPVEDIFLMGFTGQIISCLTSDAYARQLCEQFPFDTRPWLNQYEEYIRNAKPEKEKAEHHQHVVQDVTRAVDGALTARVVDNQEFKDHQVDAPTTTNTNQSTASIAQAEENAAPPNQSQKAEETDETTKHKDGDLFYYFDGNGPAYSRWYKGQFYTWETIAVASRSWKGNLSAVVDYSERINNSDLWKQVRTYIGVKWDNSIPFECIFTQVSVEDFVKFMEYLFPSKKNQENEVPAFEKLKAAIHADEDYAWSIYCNLAVSAMDTIDDSYFKHVAPEFVQMQRMLLGRAIGRKLMMHLFKFDVGSTKLGEQELREEQKYCVKAV